jgi:hypothetical protein
MTLEYSKALAEDLNIGVGSVSVTSPAGGTMTGNKIALSTFGGPLVSSHYNFTAQTPGGTLTGGVGTTVTLTPVPVGVAGADTGHYLYISDGTGTAEAVLITGGTATSGATTGTVTFTPANNHSGAWTITSATGGIQEALNIPSILASYANTVLIPPVVITLRSPINISKTCRLIGSGMYLTNLLIPLAATFTGIEIETSDPVELRDFQLATQTTPRAAGTGITVDGTGANVNSFSIFENLYVLNQDIGINFINAQLFRLVGTTVSGCRQIAVKVASTVSPDNGDSVISGCWLYGMDYPSPTCTAGIQQISSGGLKISGTKISSVQYGYQGAFTTGTTTGILSIVNNSIENCSVNAISLVSSTGYFFHVEISGNELHSLQDGVSLGGLVSLASITGNTIKCVRYGVDLLSTADKVIIDGNTISGTSTGGSYGVIVEAGATNVTVGINQVEGFTYKFGDATNLVKMEPIDSNFPTIASGATVTLTSDPIIKISGTTPIATLNTGWQGRRIRLIFTNASPGGVTTGGNILSAAAASQFTAIDLTYDGTNWSPDASAAAGAALTSINASSVSAQTIVSGTGGTDFAISTVAGTGVTTVNLPNAGASARGVVSTGTQAFAGNKTFNNDIYEVKDGNNVKVDGTWYVSVSTTTKDTSTSELDVTALSILSPPALGRVYRLHLGGNVGVSTSGTDTVRYRVYMGGSLMFDSGALDLTSASAIAYDLNLDLTIRTAGSSGVVQSTGRFCVADTTFINQIVDNLVSSVTLTGTPIVKSTVQFSVSNATNQINERTAHIQSLN